MTPYLSISETEPVTTDLELYYETSTSGNFVELNEVVRLSFTGVDGVTESVGDFYESDIIGASAVNGFRVRGHSQNTRRYKLALYGMKK